MYQVRVLVLIFVVAFTALVAGCGGKSMAIQRSSEALDLNGKSIALFTVQSRNSYRERYQPEVTSVSVDKVLEGGKYESFHFRRDPESNLQVGGNELFTARISLEPGKYILRGAHCWAQVFPFYGGCFLPVHGEFTVESGKILYLGRIHGVIRERQGNEFRAGLLIPLVDQAVLGFSGGTWDVDVSDAFEVDSKHFVSAFPVLGKVQIEKQVLPPFDRAAAQKYWEGK